MTNYISSDDQSFNAALADYTDGLIDQNNIPVIDEQSETEMTRLITTIYGFHKLAVSIKPDEELKKNILKAIQAEWEHSQLNEKQAKRSWLLGIIDTFKQPVLQRVSFFAAITLVIIGIALCMHPVSQTMLGTAENVKTGLTIVLFALAAFGLIWLIIKDKK